MLFVAFRQFLAGRTHGPSLTANRLPVRAGRSRMVIGLALVAVLGVHGTLHAGHPTLSDAQSLFFNAQYNAAAALALELRTSDPDDLALWELRTSGLLFQLKGALDDHADKEKAFKQCVECPGLLTAFLGDTARGVALAHERLQSTPDDDTARFFLGKLNLNYVWLQLGPLGRKTGWDQYWEARRSLDAVLARNPSHVRARVARAWIDYIVDTRMPLGTKWLLGGGNRKRAMVNMQDAAEADADFFAHAEARFALWDLQVRERNVSEAVAVARELAADFPGNPELAKYIDAHAPAITSRLAPFELGGQGFTKSRTAICRGTVDRFRSASVPLGSELTSP